MKRAYFISAMLFAWCIMNLSCHDQGKNKPSSDFVTKNINSAADQYRLLTAQATRSGQLLNPKSFIDGKVKYISKDEWTSGFFPGSLWYLYDLTGDDQWKELAGKYTEALDSVKFLTSHHDIGFMIGSSFGKGIELGDRQEWKDVVVQAAKSLSTRFRPSAGIIQSWNADKGWQAERGWECPVIIDNLMNLELLFRATAYSGDSTYYQIAVSHANKTMANHFRQDNSCWHVVDYSPADGSVRSKQTAQGYSDDSAWSRGQAWAIYGYTMCYRETHDRKYLDQAEKTFAFVAGNPNLPADGVPYWDFNAPDIPDALRDASAAAIIASALYELSTYVRSDYYRDWADRIMTSLASPAYHAKAGENGNFILMHSVGSIPHHSEVDVPLNYADYYFLEALKRKRDLEM
jgi:hypothetical protein